MKQVTISPVDTLFVNGSYPIEFLLYYRHPLPLDAVENALEEMSALFWPLCGTYEEGVIRSCGYDKTALI